MRLLAHTRSLAGASVLLVGASASAQTHVIPPGQERLVGEMLGRSASMGGCRLARADIQPTQIAATYECADAGGGVSVVPFTAPTKR